MILPKWLRKETKEELVIRWADALIADANYQSVLNKHSLLMPHIMSHEPEEVKKEFWNSTAMKIRKQFESKIPSSSKEANQPPVVIAMKAAEPYFDAVKKHLLNNEYITISDFRLEWKLTEKGKLVKLLGGHNKYKAYELTQIYAARDQKRINIGLVIATVLAAGMPWVVEYCKPMPPLYKPVPCPAVVVRYDTAVLNLLIHAQLQKTLSNLKPTISKVQSPSQ